MNIARGHASGNCRAFEAAMIPGVLVLLALVPVLTGCGDGNGGGRDADADSSPDSAADEGEEMLDGEGEGGPDAWEDDGQAEEAEDVLADDAAEEEISPPSPPILADYDSELRESSARSDGHVHVDSPLLVERLVGLNAGTYAFLLYHDTEDRDDLQEFLPLAEAAGLETWVYLVPPSELPAQYPPYEDDYVAWGRAIGELAASHPGLTGFVMDDFGFNLATFTVETTCAMHETAREWRPDIKFYAVDYFGSVMEDFRTNDLRGCVDGILFVYEDVYSNAALQG